MVETCGSIETGNLSETADPGSDSGQATGTGMICAPDYHMHTLMSGDNNADPIACCEKALSLGMEEICITDHLELQECSFLKGKMNLRAYHEMIMDLREQFRGRLRILFGLEFGFYPGCRSELEIILRDFPMDFMIGSVHYVNDVGVAYAPELYPFFETLDSPEQILTPYFDALEEAAKCDLFSVIGHADLIFTHAMVHFRDLGWGGWAHRVSDVVRALISAETGLEINTGGLARGFPDTTPEAFFLRAYRESGGRILTLGSDSHSPEEIGSMFSSAIEKAVSLGFEKLAIFRRMEPRFIPMKSVWRSGEC
ncbi:MAG: hypothetical protein CVV64_10710 [Candidatus Wallbacteria bacterium HGW-Wallbacteria-1]|jgi:histidinol-phosphatase (PHP family)|uniref:Histidinol-phosphatase n=1 Tax=Candidatus Wallbacteria bacterium HGW-Wallbacteria-1 TaxID=2013854 RepID=A0A2N1PPD5_9BACT|nr:MAG: hypothetical protein CVV64_10710 [Candidatus Wallbacteria bacterium HGW-Wallbacteria-1]